MLRVRVPPKTFPFLLLLLLGTVSSKTRQGRGGEAHQPSPVTLKSVLGCGDDYYAYFITTPQIKIGEKETGCFGEGSAYTIGGRGHTVDITVSQTAAGAQWSGWGTALKPAHEPIALSRKPIKVSIARNCQEGGVGPRPGPIIESHDFLNLQVKAIRYANGTESI